MASATRRTLEDFDNSHDFERLAADVLNGLGYEGVEPMSAAGGADGGVDIRFRDGDETGLAFVSLEKNIAGKFARDLAKLPAGEGVVAVFCSVDVSPKQKATFARDALGKGYRLDVFDLERLRSLLDASLKDVRRRYLGIEDDVSAEIRSRVKKLLRFPEAFPQKSNPTTVLESSFADPLPSRLADLLMEYDEDVIVEVPVLGPQLQQHLVGFYDLRCELADVERRLLADIGSRASCRIGAAWVLQLRYNLLRVGGASSEDVARGPNFLNYSMSWTSAEREFLAFEADAQGCALLSGVLAKYEVLLAATSALRELSQAP